MKDVLITKRQALWLGRFQPPSIGHVVALLALLAYWEKLTIGIVHRFNKKFEARKTWQDYLAKVSDVTDSVEKNPFTPDEILEMWTETIKHLKLTHRVTFVSMARVAFQPDFNKDFPIETYDLVDMALHLTDPTHDHLRRDTFERILNRPIAYVYTPWKMHVSEMRERIRSDKLSWSDCLPPGGYESFIRMNGPERMR